MTHPAPANVAVIYHPRISDAKQLAEEVAAHTQSLGAKASCGTLQEDFFQQRIQKKEFQLVVSLGGDGTMLRAGHICAPSGTPILGINIGRLGFLSEFRRENWKEGLRKILAGEYWLEQHLMLRAEHSRNGKLLDGWDVLNECAVTRGPKMILLETAIDRQPLTTFAADGLIVATPTGSTAYALAAGGPILPPELRNILLVPLAPHLSVERAMVLPEGAEVSICVQTESQAVLSCDGQASVEVQNGDVISARASEYSALFARVQGQGYFYRNITARLNRNPEAGRPE